MNERKAKSRHTSLFIENGKARLVYFTESTRHCVELLNFDHSEAALWMQRLGSFAAEQIRQERSAHKAQRDMAARAWQAINEAIEGQPKPGGKS